ncbi:hypothetical protein ACRE_047590 [Hapsidospora chrysogenum ATCC 11550]|uniref:Uncharacterized protein n=1 Tax=Hapsidospora chrysogenum (strain ATCC 11550 / CBS 779.69 / DSM 880 / IAM 14645 / JCM 23072 / IMI 49137) TaxID=857340 RepID=A0A086T514_HAPC1|nr:hypothetical protein ACRE_047590 [Hapsidospora chrysogenum ATCC 11550]
MKYILIFTILGFSITGGSAQYNGWPGNPCETVGASCDPIIESFCAGPNDAAVNLPCGPNGMVGVGCCWHAPVN